MASLNISNFWSLELQGETYTGKHGASTDSTDDPFEITGIDEIESDVGQLATATARTLWDMLRRPSHDGAGTHVYVCGRSGFARAAMTASACWRRSMAPAISGA